MYLYPERINVTATAQRIWEGQLSLMKNKKVVKSSS